MKFYYAGAESDLKNLSKLNVKRLLISIANGKNQIKKIKDYYPNDEYKLIMDSGAFTFFKKNKKMNCDKWIEIVDEVKDNCTEIISLDVIRNDKETYENYLYIKEHIDVIPTFHLQSDFKYLKKYLEYTDRICIGGMVYLGAQSNLLQLELNKLFSLFSKDSLPKFHAFGIFNQAILEKYPFYSCDASTWNTYVKFNEFEIIKNFRKKRAQSFRKNQNLSDYSLEEILGNIQENRIDKLKISVKNFVEIEYYLTKLWEKRGIKWN